MCRTTAHAHHFQIVWPTHQLSLMLVSNICHSPFRKFMWQNGSRLCFSDLWEEGINAGLLNYSFNGNSINNRSNHNAGKSNYAYLNLQSGINIGSWRLRDNSTWSYYSGSSNSSDSNKWQHINTSAERDIIPLRSRLTVGDSYTDGDIFDSVNFRGLKINSTEAMLPDSQHGFAPVIHGIARGTAQVSVKQNGYDVYQTTVPPGPFTIDDINSASMVVICK